MAFVFERPERPGRWYISFLGHTGKQVQRPTEPGTSKVQAKRLAAQAEQDAERIRNGDIAAPRDETLGELIEWWLTTYVSQHAWAGKTGAAARKHLVGGSLGALRLRHVTAGRIEAFLQAKLTDLSPATVNKLRRALITAFNRARKAGRWAGPNPAQDTDHRRESKRASHHYLRAEEVEPVMAALDPRWRSLFACAVYLGLRRGELAALRKRSIHLEQRELTVEASWGRATTKGGHSDVLPIPEALVPFLQAAMEASPSDLVFPGTDGNMMKVDIKLQHVLRRALARANIVLGYLHRCRGRKGKPCRHEEAHSDRAPRRCPTHRILLWPKAQVRPVRWHDLRHSTASLLNVAGVSLAEAQKILRHSDPKLTAEIYTHVERTRLRAAANRMPIAVGHLVPQRVVDRMLTGAAKTEPEDTEEKKSLGVTEASKSGKRDLNPRPSPWQGDALPLSYSRRV
jgi:integrase